MMAESKAEDNSWLPDDLHLAYDFLLEDASAESRKRVIEQENDNEEVFAALTRRLTVSTPHKENVLATSPQSTLYGLGMSSSFSSNNCSPDGLSTPFEQQPKGSGDALDLLYAAAGRVVRLGLDEDRGSRKPDRRHFKPSPNQFLVHQQLQAAEFQQMRLQLLKQELAAAWRGGAGRRMDLSAAAWPALQKAHQHRTVPGSVTGPALINGYGARRGSTGTGVFLPRHAGTPSDRKKKPTCSNVLLPARVVQSSNHHPRGTNTYFEQGKHINVARPRSNMIPQQPPLRRSNGLSKPTAVSSSSHAHHRLPQEWTY
ncbi:Uncharacterized protein M6B38_211065 [Iris pallida]|uniref:Uncharacterized protein n=1 Tax=Iris pallida TaxID=29817 RepID=A0AAX6E433_IRIPA|nr:Uncharacterized protein M6B38_211065 [Iris pallida]